MNFKIKGLSQISTKSTSNLTHSYTGVFAKKPSKSSRDGLAIWYRADRLALHASDISRIASADNQLLAMLHFSLDIGGCSSQYAHVLILVQMG